MAVRVKITAEGAWAWIATNPGAIRADKVRNAIRRGQREAIKEWTKLNRGVGLALRFEPEAFGVLGLTSRSAKYETAQYRTLGNWYPYVAPLSRGSNQLSPSGTMKRLILGGGYSISSVRDGDATATTRFSVTRATILNRLKDPWRSIYTREFLGLDRGGKRDAAWIIARSNELSNKYLNKEIISAERAVLRTAAASTEQYEGAA